MLARTPDLIQDPPVTIKLGLTERELDTIWRLMEENEFYTLEEQNPARAASISPEYKYSLYVHAEGYPDRTIIMTELYYSHTSNECYLRKGEWFLSPRYFYI